jgi:hypothetical protein
MTARLQFTQRDVLDALDRAIKPLDETASMLTLNDDLLDLLVDELVPEDDAARIYKVDNWLLLLDICTPDAYELAMVISDCHQAGHSWHGTYTQLSARYDESLVPA